MRCTYASSNLASRDALHRAACIATVHAMAPMPAAGVMLPGVWPNARLAPVLSSRWSSCLLQQYEPCTGQSTVKSLKLNVVEISSMKEPSKTMRYGEPYWPR